MCHGTVFFWMWVNVDICADKVKYLLLAALIYVFQHLKLEKRLLKEILPMKESREGENLL